MKHCPGSEATNHPSVALPCLPMCVFPLGSFWVRTVPYAFHISHNYSISTHTNTPSLYQSMRGALRAGCLLCREGRRGPAICHRCQHRLPQKIALPKPLPEAALAQWQDESHPPPRCKIKISAGKGGEVSSNAFKIQTEGVMRLMTQDQITGSFMYGRVKVRNCILCIQGPFQLPTFLIFPRNFK